MPQQTTFPTKNKALRKAEVLGYPTKETSDHWLIPVPLNTAGISSTFEDGDHREFQTAAFRDRYKVPAGARGMFLLRPYGRGSGSIPYTAWGAPYAYNKNLPKLPEMTAANVARLEAISDTVSQAKSSDSEYSQDRPPNGLHRPRRTLSGRLPRQGSKKSALTRASRKRENERIVPFKDAINATPHHARASAIESTLEKYLTDREQITVGELEEILQTLANQPEAVVMRASSVLLRHGLFYSLIKVSYTNGDLLQKVLRDLQLLLENTHGDSERSFEDWKWHHTDRELFIAQFQKLRIIAHYKHVRRQLLSLKRQGKAALVRVEREMIHKVVSDFLEQLGEEVEVPEDENKSVRTDLCDRVVQNERLQSAQTQTSNHRVAQAETQTSAGRCRNSNHTSPFDRPKSSDENKDSNKAGICNIEESIAEEATVEAGRECDPEMVVEEDCVNWGAMGSHSTATQVSLGSSLDGSLLGEIVAAKPRSVCVPEVQKDPTKCIQHPDKSDSELPANAKSEEHQSEHSKAEDDDAAPVRKLDAPGSVDPYASDVLEIKSTPESQNAVADQEEEPPKLNIDNLMGTGGSGGKNIEENAPEASETSPDADMASNIVDNRPLPKRDDSSQNASLPPLTAAKTDTNHKEEEEHTKAPNHTDTSDTATGELGVSSAGGLGTKSSQDSQEDDTRGQAGNNAERRESEPDKLGAGNAGPPHTAIVSRSVSLRLIPNADGGLSVALRGLQESMEGIILDDPIPAERSDALDAHPPQIESHENLVDGLGEHRMDEDQQPKHESVKVKLFSDNGECVRVEITSNQLGTESVPDEEVLVSADHQLDSEKTYPDGPTKMPESQDNAHENETNRDARQMQRTGSLTESVHLRIKANADGTIGLVFEGIGQDDGGAGPPDGEAEAETPNWTPPIDERRPSPAGDDGRRPVSPHEPTTEVEQTQGAQRLEKDLEEDARSHGSVNDAGSSNGKPGGIDDCGKGLESVRLIVKPTDDNTIQIEIQPVGDNKEGKARLSPNPSFVRSSTPEESVQSADDSVCKPAHKLENRSGGDNDDALELESKSEDMRGCATDPQEENPPSFTKSGDQAKSLGDRGISLIVRTNTDNTVSIDITSIGESSPTAMNAAVNGTVTMDPERKPTEEKKTGKMEITDVSEIGSNQSRELGEGVISLKIKVNPDNTIGASIEENGTSLSDERPAGSEDHGDTSALSRLESSKDKGQKTAESGGHGAEKPADTHDHPKGIASRSVSLKLTTNADNTIGVEIESMEKAKNLSTDAPVQPSCSEVCPSDTKSNFEANEASTDVNTKGEGKDKDLEISPEETSNTPGHETAPGDVRDSIQEMDSGMERKAVEPIEAVQESEGNEPSAEPAKGMEHVGETRQESGKTTVDDAPTEAPLCQDSNDVADEPEPFLSTSGSLNPTADDQNGNAQNPEGNESERPSENNSSAIPTGAVQADFPAKNEEETADGDTGSKAAIKMDMHPSSEEETTPMEEEGGSNAQNTPPPTENVDEKQCAGAKGETSVVEGRDHKEKPECENEASGITSHQEDKGSVEHAVAGSSEESQRRAEEDTKEVSGDKAKSEVQELQPEGKDAPACGGDGIGANATDSHETPDPEAPVPSVAQADASVSKTESGAEGTDKPSGQETDGHGKLESIEKEQGQDKQNHHETQHAADIVGNAEEGKEGTHVPVVESKTSTPVVDGHEGTRQEAQDQHKGAQEDTDANTPDSARKEVLQKSDSIIKRIDNLRDAYLEKVDMMCQTTGGDQEEELRKETEELKKQLEDQQIRQKQLEEEKQAMEEDIAETMKAFQEQLAQTQQIAVMLQQYRTQTESEVGEAATETKNEIPPLSPEDAATLASLAKELKRSPDLDFDDPPTEEEIRQFAEYLGMDLEQDTDLFYIAEWGLTAPLPAGWTVHLDSESNEFFFNTVTKVSQYEHPMDKKYRELYERMKAEKAAGRRPVLP